MGLLFDRHKSLKCWKCDKETFHTKLSYDEEIENTFGYLGVFGAAVKVLSKFMDHKTFGLLSKQMEFMAKTNSTWGYKCDVCGTLRVAEAKD